MDLPGVLPDPCDPPGVLNFNTVQYLLFEFRTPLREATMLDIATGFAAPGSSQ